MLLNLIFSFFLIPDAHPIIPTMSSSPLFKTVIALDGWPQDSSVFAISALCIFTFPSASLSFTLSTELHSSSRQCVPPPLHTLFHLVPISRYRDHLQTLSCLTSENKNGLRVDLSHMGGLCCGNAQKNMSHPKTYLKTASTEKGIIHLRGRNHFAPVLNWGILSIHVP